jgi:serine phosphatase RsbU (regulator of sigma subunit)/PAS domain-containing protein
VPEAGSLLRISGHGRWDYDPGSGVLTLDDLAASILGRSPMPGRVPFEHVVASLHPDDAPSVRAAVTATVGEGTPLHTEARLRRPDGHTTWVRLRGGRVSDAGGSARVVGLVNDSSSLRSPGDRTGQALAEVSEGVLVLDRAWIVVYANRTAESLLGCHPGSLPGRTLWDEVPDGAQGLAAVNYRWSLEHQRPVTFDAHGPNGPMEIRCVPAPDSLTVYLRSTQAEHRAVRDRDEVIERLEAALSRGRHLLELSRTLATAHDVGEVGEAVTRFAGSHLGTLFAGIALVDRERGRLRFVAMQPLPVDITREWSDTPLTANTALHDTARTGRSHYHTTREAMEAAYPGTGVRMAAAGIVSVAHLPLLSAESRLVGVLVLSWESSRTFSHPEREFLTTMAAYCAQALDRALLFEQQQTVAEAFQRAALPQVLPTPGGWEMAARYVPATQGLRVGGDWYDAFLLGDGRLVVAVGDAAGHGLAAAQVMSGLRHGLRAYAALGHGPAATLDHLDRLLAALEPETFATAVVLEVDPATGGGRWASRGHPPLLWCDSAGVHLTGENAADPPLGCRDLRVRTADPAGGHGRDHPFTLAPGEAVLLYTDGLVESRSVPLADGLDSLVRAAAACRARPAEPLPDLVDALLADVIGPAGAGDDVCLVAVGRAAERT